MEAKSTFQVVTCGALSADDFKVLVLLYQPIMGMSAHSMYLTLYHLVSKQTYQSEHYSHQFLLDLLSVKQQSALKTRNRLEALGLLEIYKKDNHYIYQLKLPLTARQFLSDTVFGQFLLSQVGEQLYHQLTSNLIVNKLDVKDYVQITKQFDELYEFNAVGFKDDNAYLGRRNGNGVLIKATIDYDKFVNLLPERYKNTFLLNRKTRDYIEKLAFVYQFNEEILAEIYKKCVQPNGQIELGQLNFKARTYFEAKKEAKPIASEKISDKKGEGVHYLNNISPHRILENYGKLDYQGQASETILDLINRKEVEIGVINALVLHILKAKNGILPHINYLEKVLETWQRRGIKTTEDAYDFVTNIDINNKEAVSKGKTNKNKAVKEYPDWVESYLKDFENMEEKDEN